MFRREACDTVGSRHGRIRLVASMYVFRPLTGKPESTTPVVRIVLLPPDPGANPGISTIPRRSSAARALGDEPFHHGGCPAEAPQERRGTPAGKGRPLTHGAVFSFRLPMHYVYILRSTKTGRYYYGYTMDLRARFEQHNAGQSPHTSKERPWRIAWYAAFSSLQRAEDFEKYLKHGAGHSFSRRHLL